MASSKTDRKNADKKALAKTLPFATRLDLSAAARAKKPSSDLLIEITAVPDRALYFLEAHQFRA